MKHKNTCIVCGNIQQPHPRIRGLLQCPNCKFICANLDISKEELGALYSEKYFKGEEYVDYVSDKAIHLKNFSRKVKEIQRIVGDTSKMTMLEIGCAYGFFLKAADPAFQMTEGLDIAKDAVNYAAAHGANARVEDYAETAPNPERYDIICMWDVIEHLKDPEKFIQKAYGELKPGGWFCVSTGDIGSVNAKLRGRNWRQIHPPTHLSYFSADTISRLLKKEGFTVQKITYPWNGISLRNVIYTIYHLRMHRTKLCDRIKNSDLLSHEIPLNLHDYMLVYARKEQ